MPFYDAFKLCERKFLSFCKDVLVLVDVSAIVGFGCSPRFACGCIRLLLVVWFVILLAICLSRVIWFVAVSGAVAGLCGIYFLR